MTALPSDIAAATRKATIQRYENDATRDAYAGARDGSLTPDEGFFDEAADAQTVVDERGVILAGDRRFTAEVGDLLWLDPASATPHVRLVDDEQAVDAEFCTSRIELDLDAEVTRLELFVAPAIAAPVAPPPAPKVRYIAPAPAGRADGSDWANAAPLTALNAMMAGAAAIDGEVWVRADAGVYTQDAPITLNAAGRIDRPLVVRGVDVNGNDMMAEIVGSRASPWSAGTKGGSECFRLNAGWGNLRFQFLRYRNQGNGCIRIREAGANLWIADCEAINVMRFVDNLAASGSASVTGLTIQRIKGRGFSKNFIRVQYASRNIVIEDVDADSERQDGDNFATGISFYGTAAYVALARCVVRNCIDTLHNYQNGDGFSGERLNHHITLTACAAYNCTDGGCDFKGDYIAFIGCHFEGNHRNYRLWGLATVTDCVGLNPTDNAGKNPYAQANISAFRGSMVRVYGGHFDSGDSASATFRAESGGILAISPSTAWSGKVYSYIEGGDGTETAAIVTTLDPADRSTPVVSSPTTIRVNENSSAVQTVTATGGRVIQLRVADDAGGALLDTGYNLVVTRQDFEDTTRPNPRRGSLQIIDTNGNVSADTPVAIEIVDTADDPIAPADLAASGLADFAWWDLRPGSLWQDSAATVPAIDDGDELRRIGDLSGHGHDWVVVDENAPARLRTAGGLRWVETAAVECFQMATTAELRGDKVTVGSVVRRAVIDTAIRQIVGHGNNNTTHWGQSVVGGVSARMTLRGNSNAASGGGAPTGKDVVLTLQSEPVELRSNATVTIAPDVADIPALGYQTASRARLFCEPDGSSRFAGRWYGGWWTPRTETPDLRFRLERQFGGLAGLNL